MATPEQLRRWRTVLHHLVRGPAPRGEEFDLCRQVVRTVPGSAEAVAAARLLLEGAMADAVTDVEDAQDVMAILRASGRGKFDLARLLAVP